MMEMQSTNRRCTLVEVSSSCTQLSAAVTSFPLMQRVCFPVRDLDKSDFALEILYPFFFLFYLVACPLLGMQICAEEGISQILSYSSYSAKVDTCIMLSSVIGLFTV